MDTRNMMRLLIIALIGFFSINAYSNEIYLDCDLEYQLNSREKKLSFFERRKVLQKSENSDIKKFIQLNMKRQIAEIWDLNEKSEWRDRSSIPLIKVKKDMVIIEEPYRDTLGYNTIQKRTYSISRESLSIAILERENYKDVKCDRYSKEYQLLCGPLPPWPKRYKGDCEMVKKKDIPKKADLLF